MEKINPCRECGFTPIATKKENGSTEIKCKHHCILCETTKGEAIRMWNLINEKKREDSKRQG